jgi:hypothetical protein
VAELASGGMYAPAIARTVSGECGHNISTSMVHRHLQKSSVNAAIPVPTMEDPVVRMLVAAIAGEPDTRDSASSSYFGMLKLDTTNVFTGYKGVARGMRNGQVMRGFKNISLKITNGARIVGAEKDAAKIADLMKATNFSHLLQNVVRSTCEMGTCIIGLKSDTGEFTTPRMLPMSYITLLTDSETPGTTTDKLVHGDITKIVFDEGGDKQHVFQPEDVGMFRIWSDDTDLTDIMGRPTYGMYGESMTLGVETPLKALMNGMFFWGAFIRRYGSGRLHFNLKLLADMLRNKEITPAAAQKTQEADAAAGQKLGANEDIYSTGREVSMIESKTGFDIMPWFEFLRKQIDRTLLQSDVGAGDVATPTNHCVRPFSRRFMMRLYSHDSPNLVLGPKQSRSQQRRFCGWMYPIGI